MPLPSLERMSFASSTAPSPIYFKVLDIYKSSTETKPFLATLTVPNFAEPSSLTTRFPLPTLIVPPDIFAPSISFPFNLPIKVPSAPFNVPPNVPLLAFIFPFSSTVNVPLPRLIEPPDIFPLNVPLEPVKSPVKCTLPSEST